MGNIYAIHAFEQEFGGLHGIESYAVIEAINDEEAIMIAEEMSREVIEDYSNYLDFMTDEANSEEELEEIIEEDIDGIVYKLMEDTNASLEELDEEYNNDPDEFLKKYKWEVI